MEYKDLIVERNGHVMTVTFNRPQALNALSQEMLDSQAAVCEEINRDDEIRVVIFTGAGRGFCSGIDLKQTDMTEGRPDRLEIKPRYTVVAKILDVDKPTIAAINGPAVGGGLALALECDIRIASDRATMSAIYARIGMPVLDGIADLLPRAVGLSRAMEMLYTADILDAAECERIGLVSRVVPHEELMNTANALAERIASRPPVAVRLTKNVMMATPRKTYADLMFHQAFAVAQNLKHASHDIVEGGRAFAEKRDPVFKGLQGQEPREQDREDAR